MLLRYSPLRIGKRTEIAPHYWTGSRELDAPEMGGCEIGRPCVQGDPIKSRDLLQVLLKDTMELERLGKDKYQRTLALVYVDGVSLSCHQLGLQNAVYVAEWDDGQRVTSECASAAFKQAQEF